jgi:small subunit ribosomal protein S6
MTHQYELMVILDPEIDERTVAPSLDKFLNVIRNDGGTIDNIDIWGRRRLAYEIQKKSEGIYAVVNFTATSESTVELDRQLKLSEAVLRTKVLRAEEAAARAVSVRAEDEKRAARKAAAAAKSPVKAAAAAAPSPTAAAAAEPVAEAPKAPKAAPKAKVAAEAPAEPAAEETVEPAVEPAAEPAATEGE